MAGSPERPTRSSGALDIARTVLLAAVLLSPSAVLCQPQNAPDRFEFRIGGQVFSRFTSAVRLDSQNRGIGTEVRLEDDVNLEERVQVGRADGIYNFSAKHYVAFAAYDIERTGTRTVSRELRFGEKVFTASTSVTALFDEEVLKVAYGFRPLVRPRATLGPSFGLHVMQFAVGLSLTGVPLVYDAETTAPLPVIGVRGDFQFARRWRLRGALEWFDIQLEDVDGLFSDFIVSVEHDTFERFGFGFGFNHNALDVESGDDDFRGTIDLSFDSVVLYFKGSLGGGRSSRR